ncbi:MAG: CNP1-like family protein [Candidatus Sedimenticola endophacoides]
MRCWLLQALLILGVAHLNVALGGITEPDQLRGDRNPNVEDYVWKEGESALPPFPEEENLLPFTVPGGDDRFLYYIDAASLSTEHADNIVRYILVIRSRRGGENVFFEGMRCSAYEYKIYAFGSKGKLRPVREPVWRVINSSRRSHFRKALSEYICEIKPSGKNGRQEILDRIRYNGG